MSYDCLGIFGRTYLFYLFTKKDFEQERERRKEEKWEETKEWEIKRYKRDEGMR